MTRRTSELDALIDRYLQDEARYRPPLGYPSKACGTSLMRPSRQFQSEHETLTESSARAELTATEGAWDSLDRDEDRALRVDAWNRAQRAVVFRVPGMTARETADLVARAKTRLARLLSDRGIIV